MSSTQRFRSLLESLGCPSEPHEVQAIMMGCIAVTEEFPWQRIHGRIWQGFEPAFETTGDFVEYFTALADLWETVARGRGTGREPIVRVAVRTPEDLREAARVRMEEIHSFVCGLRLMHPAGVVWPEVRGEAVADLRRIADLWRMFVREAEHMPFQESCERMAKLDHRLKGAMREILRPATHGGAAMPLARRSSGRRADPEPSGDLGVGSIAVAGSDPCPCGSGFSMSRCCGAQIGPEGKRRVRRE